MCIELLLFESLIKIHPVFHDNWLTNMQFILLVNKYFLNTTFAHSVSALSLGLESLPAFITANLTELQSKAHGDYKQHERSSDFFMSLTCMDLNQVVFFPLRRLLRGSAAEKDGCSKNLKRCCSEGTPSASRCPSRMSHVYSGASSLSPPARQALSHLLQQQTCLL